MQQKYGIYMKKLWEIVKNEIGNFTTKTYFIHIFFTIIY